MSLIKKIKGLFKQKEYITWNQMSFKVRSKELLDFFKRCV